MTKTNININTIKNAINVYNKTKEMEIKINETLTRKDIRYYKIESMSKESFITLIKRAKQSKVYLSVMASKLKKYVDDVQNAAYNLTMLVPTFEV